MVNLCKQFERLYGKESLYAGTIANKFLQLTHKEDFFVESIAVLGSWGGIFQHSYGYLAKVCHERDNANLQGLDGSVGPLIKNKAINLRLDVHITLHDAIADGNLKVDLRIINDNMKQRYNTEKVVSVMEAAKECPSDTKLTSDGFKLSIENETIIDRFLLNGANIYSVDSLQISGLEFFFVNTYLAENGLYLSQMNSNNIK